jgi:hypothetical protein
MRAVLLSLTLLGTIIAADAPKPAPRPAPVDPATAKKAEEAADAYLKQADARPDPLAETALAEIEVLLLEVHAFIDAKQPLKAGERYLGAVEKRKAIAPEQRPLLGRRLQKADADILALARELLGQAAFDLGDPPADRPAAAPATPAK